MLPLLASKEMNQELVKTINNGLIYTESMLLPHVALDRMNGLQWIVGKCTKV